VAVDDEPVSEEQGQDEGLRDDATAVPVGLVDVAHRRSAEQPSKEQPRRQRQSADVDRRRSGLPDQCHRRSQATGRFGHKPEQPSGSQRRLAQDGHRDDRRPSPAGLELDDEGPGGRHRDDDHVTRLDEPRHRLEQHPVRPVEVCTGVDDEHGATRRRLLLQPPRRAAHQRGPDASSALMSRNHLGSPSAR
jgi:hypothetical protein